MRKNLLALFFVLALCGVGQAQSLQPERSAVATEKPKTDTVQQVLKAELTVQQWNFIISIVERSMAPYPEVKQALELLVPQLIRQAQEPAKKK